MWNADPTCLTPSSDGEPSSFQPATLSALPPSPLTQSVTFAPVWNGVIVVDESRTAHGRDRKSTRLNCSHANSSYAVFCLKKKMCPLYDNHRHVNSEKWIKSIRGGVNYINHSTLNSTDYFVIDAILAMFNCDNN